MTVREHAIQLASRTLKGEKSVATFSDPLRVLPTGKKPKVRPKIKRD